MCQGTREEAIVVGVSEELDGKYTYDKLSALRLWELKENIAIFHKLLELVWFWLTSPEFKNQFKKIQEFFSSLKVRRTSKLHRVYHNFNAEDKFNRELLSFLPSWHTKSWRHKPTLERWC